MIWTQGVEYKVRVTKGSEQAEDTWFIAYGTGGAKRPDVIADYELDAPFPNPFAQTTTVTIAVPEAGDVELSVFDVRGREVARLHNGWIGAGYHAFEFSRDVPSGVYLVRLLSSSEVRSTTMIKAR